MKSNKRPGKGELTTTTGFINAGGRGTRLKPLFEADPKLGIAKGLLEIGQPPLKLIDHHIAVMARAALRNIVVNSGDLTVVRDYVEDRYKDDDRVSVTTSPELLGNGGDLLTAIHNTPDNFADTVLVTNVDTITDISLRSLWRHHQASGLAMTIALSRRSGVPHENAFYVNDKQRVIYSHEATRNPRSLQEARKQTVWRGSSTGTVVAQTDYLQAVRWSHIQGKEYSLYQHILSRALGNEVLSAYNNGQRFFTDVGTPATWLAAESSPEFQKQLCYDGRQTRQV